MAFESHLGEVLNVFKEGRRQTLNNVGSFLTAEAQLRAPVDTGNMRRSTTFDVPNDNEVDVGVTNEAPYAPYVELGTSKQRSQAFLQPAVTDNISKLEDITGQTIKAHMG